MATRVLQDFVARVGREELGQDVQIIYRVAGGMPGERVQHEVTIDSVNGAKVSAYDAIVSPDARRTSIQPQDMDVAGLFKQVSAGMHSLRPDTKTTFRPDALVGSLTIRIGSDEETFHFVPEEEKRRGQGSALAPMMERALQRLWTMTESVQQDQKGPRNEGLER